MYIMPEDVQAPQFMMVTVHSEYEQTVRFFISEQAARDAFAKQCSNGNEVYISKIIA